MPRPESANAGRPDRPALKMTLAGLFVTATLVGCSVSEPRMAAPALPQLPIVHAPRQAITFEVPEIERRDMPSGIALAPHWGTICGVVMVRAPTQPQRHQLQPLDQVRFEVEKVELVWHPINGSLRRVMTLNLQADARSLP